MNQLLTSGLYKSLQELCEEFKLNSTQIRHNCKKLNIPLVETKEGRIKGRKMIYVNEEGHLKLKNNIKNIKRFKRDDVRINEIEERIRIASEFKSNNNGASVFFMKELD